MLIWVIGIFAEILVNYFPTAFYFLPFLKYNCSIVCHTESEKLFNIGIYRSLVCSRCTGIYLGGLFSSIIILLGFTREVSTKLLLLSSIPIFADVFLYSFEFYSYYKYSALFTGFLLGSVGFIYIHRTVIEMLINKKGKS